MERTRNQKQVSIASRTFRVHLVGKMEKWEDRKWWCKKIASELIIHTYANRVPEEQKGEEPTKSTDGVLAKDPLKVELAIEESPITQKCES